MYVPQVCTLNNVLVGRDEALLSISPASHGQLLKMLIILEPHGIFGSNCILVYSNTVQPLVCKTMTRLLIDICRKSQYLF